MQYGIRVGMMIPGVLPRCVLLKEHLCFAQKSTFDSKKVRILDQFWYKT